MTLSFKWNENYTIQLLLIKMTFEKTIENRW